MRAGKKSSQLSFGDEVGGLLIVAGTSIDVNKRIVGSFLLQEIVELGLEVVCLLFSQIGANDLWDGHATNRMSENFMGQSFCCFGYDSFEHGDFGGLVGESDHEFVFTIGNEGPMNVQINGGVGYLGSFLCLLKHLTIIAGLRMLCNVFSHTQPTIVFLKILHLVFDGHIWMSLPEVANDRLPVFEGQV